MLVTISSLIGDPLGNVELDVLPKSQFGAVQRRMSRVKTLDGGYALNDSGHAASDRDIRLYWRQDADKTDAIEYLVRTYGSVYVSCDAGFFLAAPQRIDTRNNETFLDLLVLEKIV